MFVCCALLMWIFAAAWIEPAMAALLIVGLMLWTGVLEWNDITGNKAARNTFVWFATTVALANGLSSTGFISWLGKEGGLLMSGISPGVATIVLLLAFYLLHYLFASTTAHTTALLPAMLTIASTIPGMNMEVSVLLMVTSLGVMGIITPTVRVQARFTTVAVTCQPKTTGASAPSSVPSSGSPAADWLPVDVHDVLIPDRRTYPPAVLFCGASYVKQTLYLPEPLPSRA